MAEAAAIVGLVAAIVGLVEFSTKVIERLSDFASDDVPEAFRAIKTQLPLFSNTLQRVQAQAEKGYVTGPTAEALTPVVHNSISLTNKLETILEKTLPARNATAFQKRLAALKSLGKDKEVLKCRDQLESNILLLVFYQTTHQLDAGETMLSTLSQLKIGPKEHNKCLRALYTSDYKALRQSNPPRLAGTCTWFVDHPQYLKWHQELDSSLLWLSAEAGCGKSVISSYLVDKLIDAESQAELPGIVCHFFFKDDVEGILALQAVLHQLFSQSPSSIKHAIGEYNVKGKDFAKEFDTLWKIFLNVIFDSEGRIVICILDALDECSRSTRKHLLDLITKLFADPGSHRVKFFITSRPYPSIERRLKNFHSIRLEGETELLSTIRDIELVVQTRVSKIAGDKNLSIAKQCDLKRSLLENADKTFLWISLVLDMIEDIPSTSERALSEMLSAIPTKLEYLYEEALSQILLAEVPRARKVIHIMLAAIEPLGVEEMNAAFSISDKDESWQQIDFESSIVDYVRDLLPRIVKVADSKFYFVHHTVKEYLSNAEPVKLTPLNWKNSCFSFEANYVLANSCIRYLMLSDFQGKISPYADRTALPHDLRYWSPERLARRESLQKSEYEGDSGNDNLPEFREMSETRSRSPSRGVNTMFNDVEHTMLDQTISRSTSGAEGESADMHFDESLHWMRMLDLEETRQIPFLIYAAQFWSIHLLAAQSIDSYHKKDLEPSALKLCDPNSQCFRAWYQVWHFNERFDKLDCPQTRGLHLIAYLGLSTLLPLIIEQGIDLHVQDDNHDTALHAVVRAAVKGRPWKDITEMLFNYKFDPNAQNGKGETALHVAIDQYEFDNMEEVVRRILKAQPNLDIPDFQGMTLLQCAASRGHPRIAQMLLDQGANVDLADRREETALFFAVFRARLPIVRMILNAGADKEKQNWEGFIPLVTGLRTYLAQTVFIDHASNQRCIEFMVEQGARILRELIQDFEDDVGQTLQSDTELLAWLFDTARRSRLPRFKDFFKAKRWVDEALW